MVARDPDPVVSVGQGSQAAELAGGQALRGIGIVKGVPQADHGSGPAPLQQKLEAGEAGGAVIGRQQVTASRIGGALLEMKVCQQKGAPLWPPEGAFGLWQKRYPIQTNGRLATNNCFPPSGGECRSFGHGRYQSFIFRRTLPFSGRPCHFQDDLVISRTTLPVAVRPSSRRRASAPDR